MNTRKTYTVKKLAELSGTSARALRFYDSIGLLKPAYYGENGYRYYEQEQLLVLQQILFYRELGFDLARIQELVGDPAFDKVRALRSHRVQLEKDAAHTSELILTIDKTIAHLAKEKPMRDKELYRGFDRKKQAEYEREIIEAGGDPARQRVQESKRRTRGWKQEQFDAVGREYDGLHKEFTVFLEKGVSADDRRVQELTGRHFCVVNRFWTPDRESYTGLGRMYCDHPDFRKLYDGYHRGLAHYLAAAMQVYATDKLK
jgi:DNA-binding transcriptional MerR regulator